VTPSLPTPIGRPGPLGSDLARPFRHTSTQASRLATPLCPLPHDNQPASSRFRGVVACKAIHHLLQPPALWTAQGAGSKQSPGSSQCCLFRAPGCPLPDLGPPIAHLLCANAAIAAVRPPLDFFLLQPFINGGGPHAISRLIFVPSLVDPTPANCASPGAKKKKKTTKTEGDRWR